MTKQCYIITVLQSAHKRLYTVLSTCIQYVFVFHSYVLDLDYDSRTAG